MIRRGLIGVLVSGMIGGAGPAMAKDCAFYGVATMQPDGTIKMRFRAPFPDCGGFAEGTLEYKPDSPDYQEVLRHIGGLRPGETKVVPPWPDEPTRRASRVDAYSGASREAAAPITGPRGDRIPCEQGIFLCDDQNCPQRIDIHGPAHRGTHRRREFSGANAGNS